MGPAGGQVERTECGGTIGLSLGIPRFTETQCVLTLIIILSLSLSLSHSFSLSFCDHSIRRRGTVARLRAHDCFTKHLVYTCICIYIFLYIYNIFTNRKRSDVRPAGSHGPRTPSVTSSRKKSRENDWTELPFFLAFYRTIKNVSFVRLDFLFFRFNAEFRTYFKKKKKTKTRKSKENIP